MAFRSFYPRLLTDMTRLWFRLRARGSVQPSHVSLPLPKSSLIVTRSSRYSVKCLDTDNSYFKADFQTGYLSLRSPNPFLRLRQLCYHGCCRCWSFCLLLPDLPFFDTARANFSHYDRVCLWYCPENLRSTGIIIVRSTNHWRLSGVHHDPASGIKSTPISAYFSTTPCVIYCLL